MCARKRMTHRITRTVPFLESGFLPELRSARACVGRNAHRGMWKRDETGCQNIVLVPDPNGHRVSAQGSARAVAGAMGCPRACPPQGVTPGRYTADAGRCCARRPLDATHTTAHVGVPCRYGRMPPGRRPAVGGPRSRRNCVGDDAGAPTPGLDSARGVLSTSPKADEIHTGRGLVRRSRHRGLGSQDAHHMISTRWEVSPARGLLR